MRTTKSRHMIMSAVRLPSYSRICSICEKWFKKRELPAVIPAINASDMPVETNY